MDTLLLRSKLRHRFQGSRKTLTSPPTKKQINCRTFHVVNYIVQQDDIFQALRGQLTFTLDSKGRILGQGLADGGLFHSCAGDAFSAVVIQRVKASSELPTFRCEPSRLETSHPLLPDSQKTCDQNKTSALLLQRLRFVHDGLITHSQRRENCRNSTVGRMHQTK